jgi:Fic family protein
VYPKAKRAAAALQRTQMDCVQAVMAAPLLVTREHLFSIHRAFLVDEGRWDGESTPSQPRRECVVGSFQFYKFYRCFLPYSEIDAAIDEFVDTMNSAAMQARHPLVQAYYAFSTLIFFIHPFHDGNGRLSRLIGNMILRKHNYPCVITYIDKVLNFPEFVRKVSDSL